MPTRTRHGGRDMLAETEHEAALGGVDLVEPRQGPDDEQNEKDGADAETAAHTAGPTGRVAHYHRTTPTADVANCAGPHPDPADLDRGDCRLPKDCAFRRRSFRRAHSTP